MWHGAAYQFHLRTAEILTLKSCTEEAANSCEQWQRLKMLACMFDQNRLTWTQRLLTAFVDGELCFTSLPTVFAKSFLKHLSAEQLDTEQLDTGQRRIANVAESQIWLVCLCLLGKTSLAQQNSINPRYDFICRHPMISKKTPCKENTLYMFTLF